MVGMRIAQLRREKKMTQRDLAVELNVSPSAIGMYEQGRRQPSADLIVEICQTFSVSTQWLLTGRPYTGRDFREDLRMLLQTPGVGAETRVDLQEVEELLRELGKGAEESKIS